MYQSGRVGDKAKKRKSPAKSGRVGIYDVSRLVLNFHYLIAIIAHVHYIKIPT